MISARAHTRPLQPAHPPAHLPTRSPTHPPTHRRHVVGQGRVGEVCQRVSQGGELPVQHRQHPAGVGGVQHQVVQPASKGGREELANRLPVHRSAQPAPAKSQKSPAPGCPACMAWDGVEAGPCHGLPGQGTLAMSRALATHHQRIAIVGMRLAHQLSNICKAFTEATPSRTLLTCSRHG